MADQLGSPNSDKQSAGVTIGNVDQGIHGSTIVGRDFVQQITNIITGGTDEHRAQRDRRAMLKLVKSFWVKGVLEQSLHGEALLELGLEARADAIDDQPWDLLLQTPGQPNRALPHGTKITNVFDEMNQSLLILGEPGSGKTTTLLELTRDTIGRAETDPTQPIPVVFNLSSWADKRQSLEKWLIDELNSKYNIPKKIGRRWVEDADLLLLFDGLDEVRIEYRDECVKAINSFRQDHLMPLVVCSRIADYETLTTRLKLQGAVLIQPLTAEQIQAYLQGSGTELLAFTEILRHDSALQELAQSPLMLSIMTLSYRDISSQDLQSLNSVEARRRHLFDAYVRQMFQRRGADTAFSPEQVTHWLAWLARRLTEHSQTIFQIEGLQPAWLVTKAQRWQYLMLSRLPFGLIGGILLGCALGGNIFGWTEVLVFGLAAGLTLGIVDGLRFNRKAHESANQLAATSSSLRKRIFRQLINIGIVWLSIILVAGIVLGTISYLFDRSRFGEQMGDLVDHLLKNDAPGLALPIAIIFGLRGSRQTLKTDIQPVENISWSWMRFALVFLVLGLLPSVVMWGYFRNNLANGVVLWNAQDGSRIARMGLAAGSTEAAALSPDGNWLIVATNDGRLRVLEAPAGKLIAELPSAPGTNAISIVTNNQGTRMVLAESDRIRLLDARDYSVIAELKGHRQWTRFIDFNLDGSRLLTIDEQEARLWNGENGAFVATFKGDFDKFSRKFVNVEEIKTKNSIAEHDWFEDSVAQPKFSSDGSRVLTVTPEGEVQVRSAADGSLIKTFSSQAGFLRAVDISPDGTRIVTVGRETPPLLWDAKTYTPISNLDSDSNSTRDWTPKGGFLGAYSVTFSSDGSRFALLSNNPRVWLGDGKTWELIGKLDGDVRALKRLQFTLNGSRLVTQDQEGTIELWDVQTGKSIATISPTLGARNDSRLVFSPAAPRFVTFSYVADGRPIAFFVALLGMTLAIFAGLRQGAVSLKVFPNQGINLSIRYAIVTLIGFGLVVAAATTLSSLEGLGGRGIRNSGISGPILMGIIVGTVAGLWYGGLDVTQHYTLRLILYLKRETPWNYVRFLDYAAGRVFLRKVGGGYIFVHRLLMDHFSALDP